MLIFSSFDYRKLQETLEIPEPLRIVFPELKIFDIIFAIKGYTSVSFIITFFNGRRCAMAASSNKWTLWSSASKEHKDEEISFDLGRQLPEVHVLKVVRHSTMLNHH